MCRSSSPFRKSQEVGSDKENVSKIILLVKHEAATDKLWESHQLMILWRCKCSAMILNIYCIQVNPLGSGKKPHPGSWVSPGLSPLAQYSNRGCTSAKENPEERPTKPQVVSSVVVGKADDKLVLLTVQEHCSDNQFLLSRTGNIYTVSIMHTLHHRGS